MAQPIPTIIEMMLREYQGPQPDWLTRARKLRDLPRYARIGPGRGYRLEVKRNEALMARQMIWIAETLRGGWKVNYRIDPTYVFLEEADFILFRLRNDHL